MTRFSLQRPWADELITSLPQLVNKFTAGVIGGGGRELN
jgi:hypothetical protein